MHSGGCDYLDGRYFGNIAYLVGYVLEFGHGGFSF
jgi:hypothetical protein